jgi:hypothetical protein
MIACVTVGLTAFSSPVVRKTTAIDHSAIPPQVFCSKSWRLRSFIPVREWNRVSRDVSCAHSAVLAEDDWRFARAYRVASPLRQLADGRSA